MRDAVVAAIRRAAASELLPRFRAVAAQRKDDGSLATEADAAAQASLQAALRQIVDAPFLGEEMAPGDQASAWAHGAQGLWCVDPLDGTTNFVQGLPHFAISVAYLERGRTRLAVVYNPVLDEAFVAERGAGATFNGEAIAPAASKPSIAEAVAGIDTKYLPRMLAMQLAVDPPWYSVRNFGAGALDWCYLALGRFDLYVHGGQKLWDYAAGALILEEAGGRLATFDEDAFWSADPWTRSIIATASPPLFGEWCATIRVAGGFSPRLIRT